MYKGAVCERPETDVVKSEIEKKLEIFDDMCRLSGIVEIDGVTEEGKIKILNHSNQQAYEVEIDTIVRTPIRDLLLALETGVHTHVLQISRIVGYYSRINNWHKSKIAELRDRRRGNYWENQMVNSEKVRTIGE